jgi:hypothetical protein
LLAWKLEHTAQEVDDTIDHALTDTAYDPNGAIAQAGGIAAYIDGLNVEEVNKDLQGQSLRVKED